MKDRPRPVPDLHTEPYWSGLLSEALRVQACEHCDVRVHPSRPCCPTCLNTNLSWVEVSGSGVVTGYCIVSQPFVAGFVTPYVVVRVSLIDALGVELIANFTGSATAAIAIGARVHVVFDEIDDNVVLANFKLETNAA